MVFAASRESKVFAHSGALVQVIRFLLKAAMYSSLSFCMMYCVITDNLKVEHEKKNARIAGSTAYRTVILCRPRYLS